MVCREFLQKHLLRIFIGNILHHDSRPSVHLNIFKINQKVFALFKCDRSPIPSWFCIRVIWNIVGELIGMRNHLSWCDLKGESIGCRNSFLSNNSHTFWHELIFISLFDIWLFFLLSWGSTLLLVGLLTSGWVDINIFVVVIHEYYPLVEAGPVSGFLFGNLSFLRSIHNFNVWRFHSQAFEIFWLRAGFKFNLFLIQL